MTNATTYLHIENLHLPGVQTSFHEAGHAVAAVVSGWPLTGASLVPDARSAGRVHLGGDRYRWARTPDWVPLSIISAAGMAASATARTEWLDGPVPATVRNQWRSRITREGGHGSHPGYDMPTLRWYARGVWHSATGEDDWMFGDKPADLGPDFDPTWLATPDGVFEVGAYAWRRAVDLVTASWGIVTAVAELLWQHRARHVSADEIRATVVGAPTVTFDPKMVGTDFWPARHSRLVWRPHGSCRRAANVMVYNT
jgi:hypothetical protein